VKVQAAEGPIGWPKRRVIIGTLHSLLPSGGQVLIRVWMLEDA